MRMSGRRGKEAASWKEREGKRGDINSDRAKILRAGQ